jgi:hypothetical protein
MTATDVPVQYFGQLERSPDGFPLGRAVPRQSSDQQGTGREQVGNRSDPGGVAAEGSLTWR